MLFYFQTAVCVYSKRTRHSVTDCKYLFRTECSNCLNCIMTADTVYTDWKKNARIKKAIDSGLRVCRQFKPIHDVLYSKSYYCFQSLFESFLFQLHYVFPDASQQLSTRNPQSVSVLCTLSNGLLLLNGSDSKIVLHVGYGTPFQILLPYFIIPVSYTHLDVYKRQARRIIFPDSLAG